MRNKIINSVLWVLWLSGLFYMVIIIIPLLLIMPFYYINKQRTLYILDLLLKPLSNLIKE